MNRFLKKALFSHITPYTAILPYNLNWMLGRRDKISKFRMTELITLVDVGCKGGLPDELYPIRHLIRHVGFDADSEECRRLNSQKIAVGARHIYPFFIGASVGTTYFNVFQSAGESSALKPDPRYAKLFGGGKVLKTIEVETTTLDAFFRDTPIRRPDMIKLDTQGTELDILKSAPECLRTTCLVEVEVEFLRMYEGQPLFHHVMEFMLDGGFDLLYLNRVFSQRQGYPGFSKGQIIFGDALFGRREDRLDHLDGQSLINYCILLINYGHLDLAYHILASRQIDDSTKEFFDFYLRHRQGRWTVDQMNRLLIFFVDKLALLLLHLRRHNGLRIDSDRSWPFR